MKKVKLLLTVLTVLTLSLASCGYKEANKEEENHSSEKVTYSIAVSDSIPPEGLKAMDELCLKANEFSKGNITLNYRISDTAVDDFFAGEDFLFACNDEIAKVNSNFASYSSPFYFETKEQALLTLNSEQFLKETSDVTQSLINGKHMGCFYNGCNIFLSSKVGDIFQFNENTQTLNIFDDLRVYGSFNDTDEFILSKMGINANKTNNREAALRFNETKSHTVMLKKEFASQIILPEDRYTVYYYKQPFKFDFNWLFINEQLADDIDPHYLGIIREAVAYAMGLNDELIEKSEKEAEQHLEVLPLTIVNISYPDAYMFADEAYASDTKFKITWDSGNHKRIRTLLE